MLGDVRLQSSARPDLGLVNKRSEFMKFLRAKIFFKANPWDIKSLLYTNFYHQKSNELLKIIQVGNISF